MPGLLHYSVAHIKFTNVDVGSITQPGGQQVETPDITNRISHAYQMSLAFNVRDVN
jgi:hypothetical protein